MTRWRALWPAGLALAIASCGGQTPAPRPPAAAPEATLHAGPLTDYVPAAGLRWMVVVRPDALLGSRELRTALELVIPSEQRRAFAQSSGVALESTTHAVVAGFDFATVYFARTPAGATVEERFSERLVTTPKVASPHSRLRRVTGVIGQTPQTLLLLDDEWIAVSVGSALPARAAEAFALGRLKKSPPALRGAALAELPPAMLEEPVAFYAPGPFDTSWAKGARGLLESATALGVTARPVSPEQLDVTVYLAGEWPEPDAASRLREAWEDLAQDSLGRLLALDEPSEAPRTSGTSTLLVLRTRLAARPLAQGLKAAVSAEVSEILELGHPAKNRK
ncbi:MAG: hypothetical protein KF718_26755 [Polyangiaceae bacterium]|nr:hypothetical protein [Polyangiaceae bacterium]